MKRSDYETAVRKSGLDPISRAMLMAAASFRKWKQGEEVDPFLSVAIFVDATGFKKPAVAPRLRLLRENGWLVDTDRKTFKQASYYSLAIGQPFKVSATRTTSDEGSEPSEPSLEQGVRHTDNRVSATRTGGCPLDGQVVVRHADREIVHRLEEEIEERLDAPLEAAAVVEEVEDDSPPTFKDIEWDIEDMERVNKVRADALTSSIKEESSIKVVEDLSLTFPLSTAAAPAAPLTRQQDAAVRAAVDFMDNGRAKQKDLDEFEFIVRKHVSEGADIATAVRRAKMLAMD